LGKPDENQWHEDMNATKIKPLEECKVLCTPMTFGRKDPALRAALEAAVKEVIYNPIGRPLKAREVQPLLAGVDGYIAGVDEIDATVLDAAPGLKVIAVYGAGYDKVDVEAATARGIVVATSRGSNSVAVAELTVAFVLSLARHLRLADAAVRRGEWPVLDGIGIRGKTVGLVGFGAIGRAVAHRLSCFDCRIVVHDPYIGAGDLRDESISSCPLDELLAQSDFVSLHVPSMETTRGMAGKAFFRQMKKGAFFINTARGALVDEEALCDALEDGHLRGAGLDCFIQEPLDRASRLLSLENVIATPHTGAHTDESLNQMGWMALENCLSVLKGGRPSHLVNPEVFREEK
jgi:phosphoglycerate dehydrogenase-like enzyme